MPAGFEHRIGHLRPLRIIVAPLNSHSLNGLGASTWDRSRWGGRRHDQGHAGGWQYRPVHSCRILPSAQGDRTVLKIPLSWFRTGSTAASAAVLAARRCWTVACSQRLPRASRLGSAGVRMVSVPCSHSATGVGAAVGRVLQEACGSPQAGLSSVATK